MDQLVGAAEIAERLGVAPRTVHDWGRRPVGFPPPVAKLKVALVWAWPDVEKWARKTGRLKEQASPASSGSTTGD